MAAFVLIAVFFVVLIAGMPISMGMGVSTLASLFAGHYSLSTLILQIEKGAGSYSLVAIPYFVLAASLMNKGGITNKIFDFAESLCSWMHGGLAQVNVISSVIFAGISGTANADAAGLGLVEIEAMDRKGYDRGWSVAITLASSILGPIIPPSVCFIVYGCLAGVSVTELFVAGVVPGVLIAAALMAANYVIAKSGKKACPPPQKFDLREVGRTFKHGFFALMAPVILLACLFSGAVTATETGIIASVYSFVVGLLYRELSVQNLKETFVETIENSAVIMFMIGMGNGIGYVLTLERVPQNLTSLLLGVTENKYVMLLLILIVLLIMGCFIDATTIRIITVPLLLPVIDALGISRLHFGVIHTVVTLLGMSTPPVGTGLLVMATISKMKFDDVVKAFVPFWIPLAAALLLITYLPQITLFLPHLIFG
ncbi:TRAP transporter large permease [Oscillibacter hominis]|uniref:TRAP transporter large permease n=1 Tax=Oscillibacter hominis TaxID=2763056 RepID=A0A7G9B2Y2_9FIRM|nr:TRAP transporter large permease [Oscillibacter hominis]QNL43913.1 TRAP transporter large permease [Oscillibacter hominis]